MVLIKCLVLVELLYGRHSLLAAQDTKQQEAVYLHPCPQRDSKPPSDVRAVYDRSRPHIQIIMYQLHFLFTLLFNVDTYHNELTPCSRVLL
jgi:hypothetical protein